MLITIWILQMSCQDPSVAEPQSSTYYWCRVPPRLEVNRYYQTEQECAQAIPLPYNDGHDAGFWCVEFRSVETKP